MPIWVDADACPQAIKEIVFRAADRARVVTTLVANTTLRTPPSPFIRTVRVKKGFDVADREIVERLAIRNLMRELRSAGELVGGPAAFTQSDRSSVRESPRSVAQSLLTTLTG